MKKNLLYLTFASVLLLGACGTGETAKQDSTKAKEVTVAKKAEEGKEKKKAEEKKAEATATAPAQSGAKESFKNCKELNKKYPSGVNKDHPAYEKKLDRDGDGRACE